MRIAIRYLTRYTYDDHVSESHNALRACPMDNASQHLLRYQVRVDPEARLVSYTDYWGTRVDCFGIAARHTRLTVIADAEVDTSPPELPSGGGPWPQAVSPADDLHEYLAPSPHVEWDARITDFGRTAVKGAGDLVTAVTSVQAAVGDFMTYESGATEVGTSVAEIFGHRSGVCQDYSHLAIAIYRSLGIPARYVSGYLYAIDSASGLQPEDEGEIEVLTHAWVEVAVPGYGWWGLDPTNQLIAGERHVKIGHGRDYEDVTPLRGVYHGVAESKGLEVAVSMSRTPMERYHVTPRPALERRREQGQHQQQ